MSHLSPPGTSRHGVAVLSDGVLRAEAVGTGLERDVNVARSARRPLNGSRLESRSFARSRKAHGEGAPHSLTRALGGHRAPVHLHELADDGKTQPEPILAADPR